MNLICGINPVLEALAAGTRHFDRLLIVKGLRNRRLGEAIRRATRLSIPLRFEMRETLDRMAAGVPHQGIIAVVSEKPVFSLEALLASAREPALLVVLDGVEDPRNLGAIIRSAEAAGADGVLLPERHSAGLSEIVGRASAGAIEHVRVARVGNLAQALDALKARGIWVVGFDAAGTQRWDAVDLKRPVALVLGGEGRGIRRLVREHCDNLVSIPHFGHVTSLNVSVAAGIALYEAVRQRGAVPSPVRPIRVRPASAPQIVGPEPDDPEVDPGARPLPPELETAPAGEVPPEADAGPITHVDIHEDVAWGQGPTILRPAGHERSSRSPRRRRGRRAPPRAPAGLPEGPAALPAARADGPPDVGMQPPRGRRRRRRRGRRSDGAPSPAGAAPSSDGPLSNGSPGRGTGGPEEPVGTVPGRRRRRRRRRP
jgi:23S rRNA (guanosine2251-2'-O)-methyltransferase